MTATQVFMRFLKETFDLRSYQYIMHVIKHNSGNKFFSKRSLYRDNFVEGYCSRNNRNLYCFMTRFCCLAPNVLPVGNVYSTDAPYFQFFYKKAKRGWSTHSVNGLAVKNFRYLWHTFLENFVESEKSFHSPFRKEEIKGIEYRFKNLDRLQEWKEKKNKISQGEW